VRLYNKQTNSMKKLPSLSTDLLNKNFMKIALAYLDSKEIGLDFSITIKAIEVKKYIISEDHVLVVYLSGFNLLDPDDERITLEEKIKVSLNEVGTENFTQWEEELDESIKYWEDKRDCL
jgi:hypothetical protein